MGCERNCFCNCDGSCLKPAPSAQDMLLQPMVDRVIVILREQGLLTDEDMAQIEAFNNPTPGAIIPVGKHQPFFLTRAKDFTKVD